MVEPLSDAAKAIELTCKTAFTRIEGWQAEGALTAREANALKPAIRSLLTQYPGIELPAESLIVQNAKHGAAIAGAIKYDTGKFQEALLLRYCDLPKNAIFADPAAFNAAKGKASKLVASMGSTLGTPIGIDFHACAPDKELFPQRYKNPAAPGASVASGVAAPAAKAEALTQAESNVVAAAGKGITIGGYSFGNPINAMGAVWNQNKGMFFLRGSGIVAGLTGAAFFSQRAYGAVSDDPATHERARDLTTTALNGALAVGCLAGAVMCATLQGKTGAAGAVAAASVSR